MGYFDAKVGGRPTRPEPRPVEPPAPPDPPPRDLAPEPEPTADQRTLLDQIDSALRRNEARVTRHGLWVVGGTDDQDG